jgi:hypothetical protein
MGTGGARKVNDEQQTGEEGLVVGQRYSDHRARNAEGNGVVGAARARQTMPAGTARGQ